MDYANEVPYATLALQPFVWGVVRSVVAEAHGAGDPQVTAEEDPVLPRRDYLLPLPSFAGVMWMEMKTGQEVWVWRFPWAFELGEPVDRTTEVVEAR